jgi:hypothetical protein
VILSFCVPDTQMQGQQGRPWSVLFNAIPLFLE